MQTMITVHLNIKGDPEVARNETVKRLNEWFTDPLHTPVPGRENEGYPQRTLLHYTVSEPRIVSP